VELNPSVLQHWQQQSAVVDVSPLVVVAVEAEAVVEFVFAPAVVVAVVVVVECVSVLPFAASSDAHPPSEFASAPRLVASGSLAPPKKIKNALRDRP